MMTTRDQLAKFGTCVYEPEDIVEIRCLRKAEAKKTWCTGVELPDYAERLEKGNAAGWDIYAGVNPRTAKGLSGDSSVSTFRVLFVDFDHLDADGCSPSEIAISRIEDAGLPTPTLVVFSGHGVHAFWRLREPVTEPAWRDLQARLIQALDSDKAIKNPERIMRLPGFKNLKREPVDAFVVDADPTRRYAADLFEQALPKLTAPAASVPVDRTEHGHREPDYKTAKARAILYASKWPSCTEGSRNSDCYRHAAQLRQFDLAEHDAWELLVDWNRTNIPPLPEVEIQTAIKSAFQHAKGTPGEKLAESRPTRPSAARPALDMTPPVDPASEAADLIEAEISGAFTNADWPWAVLTDLGQALTPGAKVMLVGGIGSSKSLAVLQATGFWIEQGFRVAVLELERRRNFHLMRALAQRTGISEMTKPAWVRAHGTQVREAFAEHRAFLNEVGSALHTPSQQVTMSEAAGWVEKRCDDGCRLIVIDPVTLLRREAEPWTEDTRFMDRAGRAVDVAGASLVLVTHGGKGFNNVPDLDSLAGGAAWSRFADSVVWLQSHDLKVSTVKTCCGTGEIPHDRTVHLLKTRSGEGTGGRLAFGFQPGLTLREEGILVKRGKQ